MALAFCLLGPPVPVFAAETDEAALGRAETILFGDQVQGGDINDRLERVEKRIFGRRKSGSEEERVERITSTLLIDRKKLKVTKKPEESEKKAVESEKKAEKPAEPVADKQAENPSEKQPEVQAETPAENPTEKTAAKAAESLSEKQAEGQPEKQVEKQAESLPDKQSEPVAQTQSDPTALKAQQPVADKPAAPKGKGKIAAKRGKKNGGKSENKTSPVAAKKPEITLTQETAALDSRKVEKHHSALDTPVSYTSSSPNRISRGASPKVHQAATLLKEGMEAHRRGEDAKAEQLFKKVVLLEPRNPDGYFNLGALAEKKKDLAGALMSYRAALNLSPNDRELKDAVDSVESMLGVETADGHRVAGGSNSHSGDVEHDELRTSETKNPEARSAEIREFYAKESAARERAAMESSDRFESSPGSYGFGHNRHKSHSANSGPATAPNFYRARAKTTRELQEEAAPYANVNEPYAPELSVSPQSTPVVNASQPQPFQLQTQRSQANMQANQPKRPSAAGAATRAILGVALSVGTSYALRSSGLHCPVCRIGGGGGALRGLLRF
ncbi:MAG: hypothetical protein C0469_02455 [Cyanobacteria bacterium DS2.3.42]|nr:hypothetical protein [Cyanobacteria bacterium DS2.3.42]